MISLPICTECQQSDKPMTNEPGSSWICDDCKPKTYTSKVKESCDKAIGLIRAELLSYKGIKIIQDPTVTPGYYRVGKLPKLSEY
jgi:hypothetical protein